MLQQTGGKVIVPEKGAQEELAVRETITVNGIIRCSFIEKEVAQQVSTYNVSEQGKPAASEMLTKYCSGYPACKGEQCQFVIGLSGEVYTKPLESIFAYFEPIPPQHR